MLKFGLSVLTPTLKADPIAKNAALTAAKLGSSYANYARLALIQSKKIATGKTLQSVKDEFIIYSGSQGIFRRQVTAGRGWPFIQSGRPAGGKMPIFLNGNKFEPLPEMVEWFKALNIPQAAWWPILRKIARDGIKPVDLRRKTMKAAETRFSEIVNGLARDLKKDIEAAGFTPVENKFNP